MPKLLLVDDEKEVLGEFGTFLNRRGYSVTSCHDALEAIRAFKKDTPDVVLADYMMPELNGLDLLKELKNLNSEVPVVLMSGAADMRTAVDALKSEAFDFLKKPVDSTELVTTLRQAMDRAEESKRQAEDAAIDLQNYGPLTHNLTGPNKEFSLIHVMGPLDERGGKKIKRAFEKLLEEQTLKQGIILVFKSITYINNVGLNLLIEIQKKLLVRGHEVTSMQLSDKMYQYFKMLGYLDYFKVVYHLDEAMDLLGAPKRKIASL